MGEEYLWAILHDLKFEKEPLEEREALISFFEKNEIFFRIFKKTRKKQNVICLQTDSGNEGQ